MGLGSNLRNIISSNYYLACAEYWLRSYTHPLDPQNPIVIYQVGKVGSSSFEGSFHELTLDRPVMKAHVLFKQHMDLLRAELGISASEYYQRHKVEPRSRYLRREVAKARDNGQGDWRFITMVRDPVAQNVSSFFQLIDVIVPDLRERLKAGTLDLNELRQEFITRYPLDCFYNRWFDLEMKQTLGIDVLTEPFDPSQGYATYKNGSFNVLLMRLESLNECVEPAIKSFLGIENFELKRTNRGDEKEFAELYRVFREEVALPASYVDGMYEGALAKRFYTDAERDRFRAAFNVS